MGTDDTSQYNHARVRERASQGRRESFSQRPCVSPIWVLELKGHIKFSHPACSQTPGV
jgi:hypothetical protein